MPGEEQVDVLYVADEPTAATGLSALLEQYDAAQLTEATNRSTALSTLRNTPVDCIVLVADPADEGLPTLLDTLRNHDPTVPIVVAPREAELEPEALPTGVTEYLPPETDDLVRRDLLAQRIEAVTDLSATPPTRYAVLANLTEIATDPSVSFETALHHLTETLSRILPVDTLSVFECTDSGVALRDRYLVAEDRHTTDDSLMITCPTDEIAQLDRTGVLADLPTTLTHAFAHDSPGVAAPVWMDSDLVGLLVASGNSFSPSEEAMFEHGADILGWRFRRRSYVERETQVEEQNKKIRALHQVAADLDEARTPGAVYEMLIDASESILEFDLAIADAAEDGYLRPKAVSADLSEEQYYDKMPLDPDDSVGAAVYETGETSLVNDTRDAEAAPADNRFLSVLTVPIDEYGILQAAAETVGAFDETDVELAELLATHGRDRLRQLDQTQQLESYTDTLERQNERLDAFASVVSHDLRNPLQVATGHLQRIKETDPDEPVASAVDEVTKSLDRMESLIDDLLALATEGEIADSLEPTSIRQTAHNAWATVPTADATLAVETDLLVAADAPRLQQLFENLFVNAIDHGGRDVDVTVGALPDRDGFFVADDGPGIDAADSDVVFEHGYTTSTDGTGVGLEIVADIAAAHDWAITVAESARGGAKFEIVGVEVITADHEQTSY